MQRAGFIERFVGLIIARLLHKYNRRVEALRILSSAHQSLARDSSSDNVRLELFARLGQVRHIRYGIHYSRATFKQQGFKCASRALRARRMEKKTPPELPHETLHLPSNPLHQLPNDRREASVE